MFRDLRYAWLFMAGALGACGPAMVSRTHPPATPSGPTRKAGLWEQTLVRDGRPQPHSVMKVCVDAASERGPWLFSEARTARDCQRTFARASDGSWRFASTCRLGRGVTLTSKGVARGNFTSHYEVRSTLAISGAPLAELDGAREIDLQGAYQGPCPAGMAPGDMRMSAGPRLSAHRLPEAASILAGV